MRLTYLGTAAAEGFPAVFCNCQYCNEARRLGEKNIRTRSQALINDDLLIDLPADTYYHFLRNGIEGDKIKYLIVTHAHSDHFYPTELNMRISPYAKNMRASQLMVLCSEATYQGFSLIPQNIDIRVIRAYETVQLDTYSVTALPARHMSEREEAFIYIVKGDKTLLYAHDTGYFYENVFSYIEDNGIVFDMISLDCTNVDIPISDEGKHMGFPNIERVLTRLCGMGAVTEDTVRYVNHFSHNGNPIHRVLEKRARDVGCCVSYDGCVVEV